MSTAVASRCKVRTLVSVEYVELANLYQAWAEEEGVEVSIPHFLRSLPTVGAVGTIKVLEVDGQLVGFMDGELKVSAVAPYTFATSNYFYVLPAYRDKAGRLFRVMLQWMKAQGAHSLMQTITDDRLMTFWARHHFQCRGILAERRL